MKPAAFVAALVGVLAIIASAAAQDGEASQRDQARSLAASGNLADALKIYDDLTASGSSEIALYNEAKQAAIAAHDLRRAAVYSERRIKIDPQDYETRTFIPLAYRVAGDEKEAARAREDFIAYWKASSDPNVRSKPFLLIDMFRAGAWSVHVIQCTEIGGDFGVGYIFDIWGPKALPLPPEQLAENHRGRIVLEHNRMDQKIMSEIEHKESPIKPTLDALFANQHVTLKWFGEEPPYGVIRDVVGSYVANDKEIAAKAPLGNSWRGLTCLPAGT